MMCACSLISTCWRSGQTGFSWCARIPHDRHGSPLRSQPLCGAQSWLAPYDGGSTITHYDVEVSEYYKNTYAVYDDSRCLAEPEPEPEPEPASAGRRRTQATEEVVCSSAGGGLRCRTRRVLQDGDDGAIP